jgi:para-nitrobenzyl esterase
VAERWCTYRTTNRSKRRPLLSVSAEAIGVNFAKKYGIEGTDAAALAKLRSLTVAQIVDGGQKLQAPGPDYLFGPY